MLKNRGKIFAPKAKGIVRRQPSAAPSSARPSVERQSQTPAPRQESVASVVEEGAVAEGIESREPGVEVQSQQSSSHLRTPLPDAAAHRHPDPDTRKRKTREEEVLEPPTKRVSTNIERPEASPAPSATSTQEAAHEAHSHPSHDTPSAERSGLKRKEREEDAVNRPAKRLSNVDSSVQSTTESETLQPRQNEDTTSRADPNQPIQSSEAAQPVQQSHEPETGSERAENNYDEESQSSREPTFQAPQHRYPSPESMQTARIVDDIPAGRLGSMGPAGGNGAAGDMGAAGRISQAAHLSEIVPRGVLNPDGTSGAIIEEPASGTEKTKKGKRKYTKRKKVQAPEIGDDGRATVEMQLVKPRRGKGRGRSRRKAGDGPKERKQRAMTPEGAEEEEIDRENMTMTDLCKDLKIGRPFSMHAEIKARIMKKKAALARAKLRRDHPELIPLMDAEDGAPAGEDGEAGPSGTNAALPTTRTAAVEEAEEVAAPTAIPAGPQMRIIDGNIVMDERTLQIDRQKNAQAERPKLIEVEENDFTRVITSGTWMKMERSAAWDMAGTQLFYDCLTRHGTDFEMIASYFPHRNRRQIKLKFNKEERTNPNRITRALVGPQKKAIDLDEFQKMSSIQLEEIADIDKERDDYDEEQEAELAKQEAAIAEVNKQKKAAIQANSAAKKSKSSAAAKNILDSVELSDEEDDRAGRTTGGESAKENREPASRGRSTEAPSAKGKKKAAPKKPRKNKHSHFAGGDEVEVLGTID